MFTRNKRLFVSICLMFLLLSAFSLHVTAQEPQGEYLKYQEPQAPTGSSSWVSTLAYILSLLVTFAVVIGLAFFTSRFLGQKFGHLSVSNSNKVIITLPLGNNRAVYVVEVAGKYLVLGVTDHSVTLLQEIVDAAEIEKMQVQGNFSPEQDQFKNIFQKHLASLQQISQSVPFRFDKNNSNQQDNGHDEKR
ncbi:hypothetical protein SPFL3102_00501 [Sporomusaceae bacterium FL31]|nr:hypothetical protein SPFL3101_01571 [Sporomusaceae bacterium FL31]GCE32705.1 hypothetical protein SPFL3102_00501 [Sporomusaceae bacterium]